MKRVIITGGTGMIGKPLSELLVNNNYEVIILTRNPRRKEASGGMKFVAWDGRTASGWASLADGAYAIINLAGENIGAGRWSEDRKRRILQSRLDAGKAVSEAIRQVKVKPKVILQASAIGIYGVHQDEVLDETSPVGNDWLAEVGRKWEASLEIDSPSTRTIWLRTGLVLNKTDGVLGKVLLPFRLFAGGPLGSGKQWWSWIHLQDEVESIKYLLENETAQGIYNLTAPEPVTMADFGKTLGSVIHRPYWLPVPAFALKLLLGEMSTLVLDGQKVMPGRLLAAGYEFHYPKLEPALADLLS